MKFITTWSVRPGAMQQAVDRFLAGEGQPPAGTKLLGRWHNIDGSGGFSLMESDNPSAMHEAAAVWIDLLELHSHPVVEDADAGMVLQKVFKK